MISPEGFRDKKQKYSIFQLYVTPSKYKTLCLFLFNKSSHNVLKAKNEILNIFPDSENRCIRDKGGGNKTGKLAYDWPPSVLSGKMNIKQLLLQVAVRGLPN